jgi:hypothetical protein
VVTEIVYTRTLSKRVQTIKKFIKLAAVRHHGLVQHPRDRGEIERETILNTSLLGMGRQMCRSLNNFNACFAILSGLTNTAVSRLQQTWKVRSGAVGVAASLVATEEQERADDPRSPPS